jgi:hypothetical protein
MENPPMDDMAAVVVEPETAPVSFPVGEPKVSGIGRGLGRKGGPK